VLTKQVVGLLRVNQEIIVVGKPAIIGAMEQEVVQQERVMLAIIELLQKMKVIKNHVNV
jgi:hypothetical protein